jgi:hypothetical protein
MKPFYPKSDVVSGFKNLWGPLGIFEILIFNSNLSGHYPSDETPAPKSGASKFLT